MTLRQLINAVMETGSLNKVSSLLYDTYCKETDDRQLCDQTYTSVVRELLEMHGDDELHDDHDMLIREHTSLTTNKQDDGFAEKYVDVCLMERGTSNTFAIDMIDWSKLIDMYIHNQDNFSMVEQLAHVLWEITFYGYTNDRIKSECDKLKKMCEDIDNGKTKLIPWDEVKKQFDLN